MLSADRSIGLISGALAVVCLVEAYRLWTGWPGPGTMPLIIGLILLINCVFFLAPPVSSSPPIAWPKRDTLVATAIIAGLFAAYVLILPWAGFLIATWALTTLVAKTISAEPTWRSTIIGMGVLAIACHFIFNSLLGASLPVGPFGF
jgi:hypothetical protein